MNYPTTPPTARPRQHQSLSFLTQNQVNHCLRNLRNQPEYIFALCWPGIDSCHHPRLIAPPKVDSTTRSVLVGSIDEPSDCSDPVSRSSFYSQNLSYCTINFSVLPARRSVRVASFTYFSLYCTCTFLSSLSFSSYLSKCFFYLYHYYYPRSDSPVRFHLSINFSIATNCSIICLVSSIFAWLAVLLLILESYHQ